MVYFHPIFFVSTAKSLGLIVPLVVLCIICFNLLAYADDLVLLSPSQRGLQYLIDLLVSAADDIGLRVNAKKTVTMVFSPTDKCKRFCSTFPPFSANGNNLSFVTCFKYLGHMIEHSLSDESDINRELKCLFVRANLLNTRFWRCSTEVKLRLFKTFCMCFYDIWSVQILQSWFYTKTCFCVCEVYKDILWVP